MIKKLALVTALAGTTGCATYGPPPQMGYQGPQLQQMIPGHVATRQSQPQRTGTQVGPYDVQLQQMVPDVVTDIVTDPAGYAVNQTSGFATAILGKNISDPFITVRRANTFLLAALGPNDVNTAVSKGLTYYRQGLGFLQNPLQTAFIQTTPWRKQ